MVGRHERKSRALGSDFTEPSNHELGGTVNEVGAKLVDSFGDAPVRGRRESNVRIRRERNARDVNAQIGISEIIDELLYAQRRPARITGRDDRDSPTARAQSRDGERRYDGNSIYLWRIGVGAINDTGRQSFVR
jgi:hypothetical protein